MLDFLLKLRAAKAGFLGYSKADLRLRLRLVRSTLRSSGAGIPGTNAWYASQPAGREFRAQEKRVRAQRAMSRLADICDVALLTLDKEEFWKVYAAGLDRGERCEEVVVHLLGLHDELLKYRDCQVGDSEEERGLLAIAKLTQLAQRDFEEALNA